MNYEMLIFDIDGTLWEAPELAMKATNILADKYKEIDRVNIEQINAVQGLGKVDTAKKLMPNIELSKAIQYVELQTDKVIELISKKGAHIYDNVDSTIKYLSTKYKLGIVTNNRDEYVKLFLDKSNLNDYFIDYVGASSYDISKSDAIKMIVDRNNILSACYIGDIKKDLIAANEANVDFIHARYGFDKKLISPKYINDIEELKKIL